MSNTVTKAKAQYDTLKEVEAMIYAHNAVNTSLPKHKERVQRAILSGLNVKRMNCNFSLSSLVRKMNNAEAIEFNKYVRY